MLTEQPHLGCVERRQTVPAEMLLSHTRLQRPQRVANHVGGLRQRGPIRCHAAPDRVEAVPPVILLSAMQRREDWSASVLLLPAPASDDSTALSNGAWSPCPMSCHALRALAVSIRPAPASHLHGSVVVHDVEQGVGRGHLVGWEGRRHAVDALHREDTG